MNPYQLPLDLAMLRNMAVRLPWMVPSHQTTLSRIADPQTMHKKQQAQHLIVKMLGIYSVYQLLGLLQWFYDMENS